MLSNEKLSSLDAQLEHCKANNRAAQTELQKLFTGHAQLLKEYKSLRKACDEDRRSKGGALPAVNNGLGKPRNSYVLVLIDGDNYIFNDELIRDKEEGGMRAARMLHDAVEKYIVQNVPDAIKSRIIVRMYADLTNLSKQLGRSKIVGQEKRSISPFSAAFTRAISTFDFVDSLDQEGTKIKIREQFKIAAEDNACDHILYAACHDMAYLAPVRPLAGKRDRVTLIQGAGWLSHFYELNLATAEFPTIFRWSAVPSTRTNAKAVNETLVKSMTSVKSKTPIIVKLPVLNGTTQSRLNNPWDSMSVTGSTAGSPAGSMVDSRTESIVGSTVEPISRGGSTILVDLSSGVEEHNGTDAGSAAPSTFVDKPCRYFGRGFCQYGDKCRFRHSDIPIPNGTRVSSQLPSGPIPPGLIPINKDCERLDAFLPAPTSEDWAIYNARFQDSKPCNEYHLGHVCEENDCLYDHNELEPAALRVLKYILKSNNCPRRSACRVASCFYGHICQRDGCAGHVRGCKMAKALHNIDPKVANMVPAEDGPLAAGAQAASPPPVENVYLW